MAIIMRAIPVSRPSFDASAQSDALNEGEYPGRLVHCSITSLPGLRACRLPADARSLGQIGRRSWAVSSHKCVARPLDVLWAEMSMKSHQHVNTKGGYLSHPVTGEFHWTSLTRRGRCATLITELLFVHP